MTSDEPRLYKGDPEVVAAAIDSMPEPVRPVIQEVAARAFAQHSLLVTGPPRRRAVRNYSPMAGRQ